MKAHNYKNKSAKEKDNYMTSGSTALSDYFYTTESNDTRFDYKCRRDLKDYDDYYTSEYFDRYDPKRSLESLDYEGYTSLTSYSERMPRKPRYASPASKSEKIYSRRYSNSPVRHRRKSQSPIKDYVAREETERRHSRPKQRAYYSLESTSEQNLRNRPRSPKRDKEIIKYDQLSYEKYFEPASREGKLQDKNFDRAENKRRKQDRVEMEVKDKKRQKPVKQQKEYHVYAYENHKPHERVFARTKESGDSFLPSEIEPRTHEYPVLAFKDRNTVNAKDSDMVYVPVLVVDKSNKIKTQKEPPLKRSPERQDNFQIYAANIGNKNFFETMGDTSNKKPLLGSDNRQRLNKQYRSKNENSFLNAESVVESILNQTLYSSRQTDSKFSKETEAREKDPFGNNQKPIVYQVNVDAAPDIEYGSMRMSQCKPTNDHLDDDYPVTKDYIKVNGSEERKQLSLAEKLPSVFKPTRQSAKPESRNPSVFAAVVTNGKMSHSITDSKDTTQRKSIVNSSFATRNQSIPHDNSLKRSMNVGNQDTPENYRISMVQAKSGSLAIPSDMPREDGADLRNTQGVTRLSNTTDRAEKQSVMRQSTKEHFVRQSSLSPMLRKSAVSHTSLTGTMAKQQSMHPARASQSPARSSHDSARASQAPPRASETPDTASQTPPRASQIPDSASQTTPRASQTPATESQTLQKKLSSIQSRPSLAKSHGRSITHIAENTRESRKSLAPIHQVIRHPEPRTTTVASIPVTSKMPRKSLAKTKQEDRASIAEQKKSKVLTETTNNIPEGQRQSVHVNENSEEALQEFTKAVFHMDYAQDSSLKRASSGQSAGLELRRKSEVKLDDLPFTDKNVQEAEVRKSKALQGEEQGEETITSVVNFSHDLEDGINPPHSKHVPVHEEKRATRAQTGLKSTTRAEELRPGTVAQSNVQPQESKILDGRQSTVIKPRTQKPEEKGKKRLLTKLFKSKSHSSHDSVGHIRSKSVASKQRRQNTAKEKTADKKRSSIFGILRRSKSKVGNGRWNTAPATQTQMAQEEPQSEKLQETILTKETEQKEPPKKCECLTEYVKRGREWGHFFLGTTLHEQVMRTIQAIC